MNERIKELALLSGQNLIPFMDPRVKDMIFERFAELIVAECVEQVLTGVRTNPPHAHPPELVQTLVRRIQRHFGVE